MLYSIVIPVYNAELYLRDCLDSIIKQTYEDFEVIVIDDGSTDLSAEISDEFANRDSRFKVYHVENRGVTKARQLGLSFTQGEYIIFVDADDTINPDLLLNVDKTIKEFSNIEIIRYKCNMVNDRFGFDSGLYNYEFDKEIPYNGIEAIKKWTKPDKRYEVFWLYAIKREKLSILEKCPNLRTSEDYGFIPLLIANCKYVMSINYIGYNYLCNNQSSLTHEFGYEKEKNRQLNFIKAYEFLITNMRLIEKETNEDLQFFYDEWRQRLLKRYNRADDTLKAELEAEFNRALNQ